MHWIPTNSRAQWLWPLCGRILKSNSPLLVENCTIVGITNHFSDKASLSLTNINGCFLFVPCQDPDLDVGLHQSLNGLGHLILELVLYRCGPQQLQVLHPKWEKDSKKKSIKKSVSKWSQQRKAFKPSCVRETCEPGLCHSRSRVFSSSAALVYHPEKTPQA